MIRSSYTPAIFTLIFVLIIWQLSTAIFAIEAWILPSPIVILKESIGSFFVFLPHMFSTIKLVIIGFIFALIFAMVFSYIMHNSKFIKRAIFPLFIISQNVPTIVLAPLFLIWFGLGDFPKIIIITLTAFFPITVATIQALDNCDKTLLHYMKMAGSDEKTLFFKLKLPYAIPNIFAGIKISATYAVTTGVVAEWLGAQKGIGLFMTLAASSYKTPRVFMAIIFIVILSLFFVGLISLIEQLFKKYKR